MPLYLFVRPPFGANQNGWQQQQGFTRSHLYLTAKASTGISPVVYACFDGILSVRPPQALGPAPMTPIDLTVVSANTLPARLNVFLHNNGYDALIELRDQLRQFFGSVGADLDLTRKWAEEPIVVGAGYAGIDTTSLLTYLAPGLRKAYVAAAGETVADKDLLLMFAQGRIQVQMTGGSAIGEAALLQGKRQVSFTILSDRGPLEPSDYYQKNSGKVAGDSGQVTQFLQEFPVAWPLLSTQLSQQQALDLIQAETYPYSALIEFKTRFNLSAGDWRTVGDYQKTIYLRRLLRRSGYAPLTSTDPDFVFNDGDRYVSTDLTELNLFQLEAVVEFYANHDEPWGGHPPLGFTVFVGNDAEVDASDSSSLTLDTTIPDLQPYISRLSLFGETSRASKTFLITSVAGQQIKLDAAAHVTGGHSAWRIVQGTCLKAAPGATTNSPDSSVLMGAMAQVDPADSFKIFLNDAYSLSQVKARVHKLVLLDDTARDHRTYLITAVDPANSEVTVDGKATILGASRWLIDLYVVVDFLPLAGTAASVPDPAEPKVLELDGIPDLYRIWPNLFKANGVTVNTSYLYDTIWLALGTRASKQYRIMSVDPDRFRVTLDEDPQLAAGSSVWRIQERPTLVMIDPFGPRRYDSGTDGIVELRGSEAKVENAANTRVLTLDRPPDLNPVIESSDRLVVGSTEYMITTKDVDQHTVTISTACLQTGILSWKIVRTVNGQPLSILNGKRAYPDSQDTTKVRLSNPPDLRRCDPCFDTIYLDADQAPARRPRKTYRIIAVTPNRTSNDLPTVELSEVPQLANGVSGWGIQAGVGGDLISSPDYNLGPGTRNIVGGTDYQPLWDHYDAILFHLSNGSLQGSTYRWTTFTSRDLAFIKTHAGWNLGWLSSVRGNQLYFFRSRFSTTSPYINYAFEVFDPSSFPEASSGYQVRQARYYFGNPQEYPFAHASSPSNNRNVIADPGHGLGDSTDGKEQVMIHQGNYASTTSGSAGCLVSSSFRDRPDNFRSRLINLQAGEVPAEFGATPRAQQLSSAAWDNKIVGRLWVIRPDELPLGTVHSLPE